MANEPSFTIGIEEEYLLVDQETRNLAADPPSNMLAEIEQRLLGQHGHSAGQAVRGPGHRPLRGAGSTARLPRAQAGG